MSGLRLALPRRRARGEPLESAPIASTTFRSERTSGSSSSPTREAFQEEAADLRSEDPLGFFDLRPYTERIAEAELSTGLGDAMILGGAVIEGRPASWP